MPPRITVALAALALLALSACSGSTADSGSAEVGSVEPPALGDCRVLTPEDVAKSSNASPVVDCAEDHTAQTFAVGTFPERVAAHGHDDRELGGYIFKTCDQRFRAFLGGDDSLVMRSTLTWAWFRPSATAWEQGARWYRCDIVGGGEQSKSYVNLPRTAKGLLLGRPEDRWMICVDGPTVSGSVKIPCSQEHTWRAVTTIKLGEPGDPYPGDRLVEVRSQDFCSDSVGAWMNYPVDYDYGITVFHEAEWKAGNRRSICWAKTER
ncbi:MAG TPA: septum formation family protein [Nocardioidaceae bacterium]|nr:septum formation family protein [Nocardioidaceae bacterium]